MDNDLWTYEERLWTGGPGAWRTHLGEGCVIVVPGAGILSGAEAIMESLKETPRWASVDISGQTAAATDGFAVLAYEARGRREGQEDWHAFCSSTWRRIDGAWKLVQHQQTPA